MKTFDNRMLSWAQRGAILFLFVETNGFQIYLGALRELAPRQSFHVASINPAAAYRVEKGLLLELRPLGTSDRLGKAIERFLDRFFDSGMHSRSMSLLVGTSSSDRDLDYQTRTKGTVVGTNRNAFYFPIARDTGSGEEGKGFCELFASGQPRSETNIE
jgi:hypothetical protein